MNFAFRLNASDSVGSGHLARCLSLADAIAVRGGSCTFLLGELNDLAQRLVDRSRHQFLILGLDANSNWEVDADATMRSLEGGVDWLVCDHYGLDERWESAVKRRARYLLVIDDLANRPHASHLLVDPGFGRTDADYLGQLNAPCQLLLGTKYALLGPRYAVLHDCAPVWPAHPRVHLFFGGGKHAQWLAAYSKILLDMDSAIKIRAIGTADSRSMLELNNKYGERLEWSPQVEDMAATYAQCSIAMGAPGTATWERACVGLPSGLIAIHKNQISILKGLDQKGFCRYLGEVGRQDTKRFMAAIHEFLNDHQTLRELRSVATKSVDGLGISRILDAIDSTGGRDG